MQAQNKKINNVGSLIPHKEPAIMVDALLELNGLKAKSCFQILPANIYLKKNELQVDGLIEHIAQTVALKMATENQDDNSEGYLTSISRMELFEKVQTGETIETTIEILKKIGTFIKTRSSSVVGKKRIAETEMSFFIVTKTQD